jgi:hypothetical protein
MYRVSLSEAQRLLLQKTVSSGSASGRSLAHARVLLKADEGAEGPGFIDAVIAEAVEVSVSTVACVRQRYVEERTEAALRRRPPRTPKFSSKDCRPCPSRERCFRSTKRYARRSITVRREEQYQSLQAAREREGTDEFKEEYTRRGGMEGTISQGVRAFGLRRSRYIGQAKTHLQHLITAAAINFVRVDRWLSGVPRAQTRHSPFVTLMQPAA